jgi:hypothetical protein
MAAARAASRPSPGGSQDPQLQARYYQPSTTTAQMSGALSTPARQGTADTQTSYIPSNASVAASEEEYHINPDGSYARDAQGRRIPFRQPLAPQQEVSEEDMGEISEELSEADDEDHAADAERERLYAAQYRQQSQPAAVPPTTTNGYSQHIPRTTAGPSAPDYEGLAYDDPEPPPAVTSAMQAWSNLTSTTSNLPSQPSSSTQSGNAAQQAAAQAQTQARHRHPTRLSDIIEEAGSRTSPSRTSYGSNVLGSATGAMAEYPAIEPRTRNVARGSEGEDIEILDERAMGRRRAR